MISQRDIKLYAMIANGISAQLIDEFNFDDTEDKIIDNSLNYKCQYNANNNMLSDMNHLQKLTCNFTRNIINIALFNMCNLIELSCAY